MGYNFVALSHGVGTIDDPALGLLDELANRLEHGNDRQRFTTWARQTLAMTNCLGIAKVIRSRMILRRGPDGRVLRRPGAALPPTGFLPRRPLAPARLNCGLSTPTRQTTADENDPEPTPGSRERDESGKYFKIARSACRSGELVNTGNPPRRSL